ncbi:hypothetical protein [Streptomyces sp. NPDC092370]|uniref:hypothetical protein n=1 Tax=Streptomyces sp. NPDC092370 TaxID=3366016 RepID=UPI0038240FD4
MIDQEANEVTLCSAGHGVAAPGGQSYGKAYTGLGRLTRSLLCISSPDNRLPNVPECGRPAP